MILNFQMWLNALDHFSRGNTLEGCALMFPLIDKAAKLRRPALGNKKRMSLFITDLLENVIALGTGLDLKFRADGPKILFETENIGEVIYRLRCAVLHEAEKPADIVFVRQEGVFAFSYSKPTLGSPATFSLPDQYCEVMHVALLGCAEFSAVTPEFVGRRIKFGRHTICPSECVGNFGVLREQLIFGR